MRSWFPSSHEKVIIGRPSSIAYFGNREYSFSNEEFKGIDLQPPITPDWWYRRVERVKQDIKFGKYQKKVLTHDISFVGENPDNFIKNRNTEGSFILQLNDQKIFYGMSPEKVISKKGNEVRVEVLGGTLNKVLSERGDIKPKLLQEHQIIIEDLIQRNPEIEILETLTEKDLGYVTHLRSLLGFKSNESNLLNIILKVYPNLTINSERINDWWGTLIGYSLEDEVHLWLGIRSGMYFPNSGIHTIRSGVGITSDSDPDIEWLELYEKTKWLLPS